MSVNNAYKLELQKLASLIEKKGIIREFNFHTIPIEFFYNLFIENGFIELPHQINKYGKKSFSLRKEFIHILMKQSANRRWINIHQDTRNHKTRHLTEGRKNYIRNIFDKKIAQIKSDFFKIK